MLFKFGNQFKKHKTLLWVTAESKDIAFNEHSVGVKTKPCPQATPDITVRRMGMCPLRMGMEEEEGVCQRCFGGGYKMWGLLGGWCERGVRWRANTLSHSHKWVTNWEPFGNVSGSFPKISFCRILGEDIYKMWEVLGGGCVRGEVRWGANTLSPAAQGRGRVLAFFSNNGSQIGSFFGSFPRYP